MLNGKQLKLKRIEKDLKLKELAQKLGVSNAYVSMVEKGKKSLSQKRYSQWIEILNGKETI